MVITSRSAYCITVARALEQFNRKEITEKELHSKIVAAGNALDGQLRLDIEPKRKKI